MHVRTHERKPVASLYNLLRLCVATHPNIAPSDYRLFLKLKDPCSGIKFKMNHKIKEEVTKFLNGLAVEFVVEAYQSGRFVCKNASIEEAILQ